MGNATETTTLDRILNVVEYAAVGTEVLAVTIILVGITAATYVYIRGRLKHGQSRAAERDYRHGLGRTLLLGLEILVAADVVRTVAVDPSIRSAGVLGMLVIIRTFLSWSLVVEMESRWPWQRPQHTSEEDEPSYFRSDIGNA